jgi:hypothetical protein
MLSYKLSITILLFLIFFISLKKRKEHYGQRRSKKQTTKDNKLDYIFKHIFETPLEKIVGVYKDNHDLGYKKVMGLYDLFLKKINDQSIRESLQIDYTDRHKNPFYLELKVTAENLQTELTRFIYSPKNMWTDRIYEYMIF